MPVKKVKIGHDDEVGRFLRHGPKKRDVSQKTITSHNFVICVIFMPWIMKIIIVIENVTKFWQQQFCSVVLGTKCKCIDSIHSFKPIEIFFPLKVGSWIDLDSTHSYSGLLTVRYDRLNSRLKVRPDTKMASWERGQRGPPILCCLKIVV